MGGLTHTGGEINKCKWYEAVGTWLLYDVDIVLFSEMQPSTNTSDVPECSFILDYNAEKIRKPGRGTGCAIHRHLLELLDTTLARCLTFGRCVVRTSKEQKSPRIGMQSLLETMGGIPLESSPPLPRMFDHCWWKCKCSA